MFFSLLLPLGFVLANLLIKGFFISYNSIALDEPFSIYYAQMELASIVEFLSVGNNPPLYELLLHFWIKVFGISPLSVRFPSLIFSCLTIYFIYRLAQTFFNNRIAIYTSVFYLFSNNAILYAHEARVYSLFVLLTTISMYLYLGLINNKPNSPFKKVFFIFIQVLLIYAHYFGFIVLLLQILFLLFNKKLRVKHWKNLLSSTLIILLFYIPNISVLINRFLDSTFNGTWVNKPNGFEDLYYLLVHFSNAPLVAVSVIMLFLLVLIKFFKEKNAVSTSTKLVASWFIIPFLFLFILSYWVPVFIERYLMFLTTGFYLLIAISLDYVDFKKPLKHIIPIIFCSLFLFTTDLKNTNKREVEETIEKIKELKTENSIVFVSPKWFDLNFLYYYNRDWFQDVEQSNEHTKMYERLNNDHVVFLGKDSQIAFEKIKSFEKIIFLDAGSKSFYNSNKAFEKLRDFGQLEDQHKFYEIFTIYEFSVKK